MATATPRENPTESLKSRISSFVSDVVTLDVLTLTGDIKFIAGEFDPTEKKFKWDTLFEKVAEKMKPDASSELQIVAYTHAEWDLDSVNFVRKELTPLDKELLAAHNSAVESAQKARFEAVKTVAGLLGVKFP